MQCRGGHHSSNRTRGQTINPRNPRIMADAIQPHLLSGSFALLAFGGDSLVEILSGFATTFHPRGDSAGSNELGEKTERATMLLLVALIPVIGGGALYSYFTGIMPESSLLGIAVALGAVIVMPVLWGKKRGIERETNCAPLLMDAVQSATCFLMSLALLGSLLINYLFGISWVDYAATAVILAFVGKESVEAFRERKTLPATDPSTGHPAASLTEPKIIYRLGRHRQVRASRRETGRW